MKAKPRVKPTKNLPSRQPNVQGIRLNPQTSPPSAQEGQPLNRIVPLPAQDNRDQTQLSIPPLYQHPINNDDVPPQTSTSTSTSTSVSVSVPVPVPEQDQALLMPIEEETKKKDFNDETESKKPTEGGKARFLRHCKMAVTIISTFFNWSFLILMIANLIILIYLAKFHYAHKKLDVSSVVDVFNYISSNLSQDPILDIIVQDGGTDCPTGYSGMQLGTWPGTRSGCYCPGRYLRLGGCDTNENSTEYQTCDGVAPRGSIKMYDWGGSKWCTLRAKPGTEYTKTESCETGFRECSPGICVLSSLSCPVTKVRIDTTGTYKLKLGTDRYVVTEKVQGEPPVIDLDITPNNIPCFIQGRFYRGPVAPYVLINANEHGCSKYGLDDEYSFEVDRQKQDELFDQNSFPWDVLSLVDYSPVYQATDSVLSYQKRMNVAQKDLCLNLDTTILVKSQKSAKDLQRYITKSLLAALIIHGCLVFFVTLYLLDARSRVKTMAEALRGRESLLWFVWLLPLGIFELIDIVVMFAASVHFGNQMIAGKNYLAKLGEMECFAKFQMSVMISDYETFVDDLAQPCFAYSFALFLIFVVCFIPFSVKYIIQCRKEGWY